MNKNKGIWTVIGSILVIGILTTFATSSFVHRNELLENTSSNSSASGNEFSGEPEISLYGASTDSATKSELSKTPEVMNKEANSETENQPDNEGTKQEFALAENGTVQMNRSLTSGVTEVPSSENSEDIEESALQETVISPKDGDAKSRVFNASESLDGEDYYKHLEDLDAQIKKMREESGDSNTYSMKAMADKELKLWVREQNNIYEAVLDGLNEEDGKKLEDSQQEWIKKRDSKAEEAAQKYSGGSLEELEYTASLAESTRARAYELVDEYIQVLSPDKAQ